MTNKRKTLRTGEASQQQVLRSEAPPGEGSEAGDTQRHRDTEGERGRERGEAGELGRRAGYGRETVVLGALGAQDRERERAREREREREGEGEPRERDPAGLAACASVERGTPAKTIRGAEHNQTGCSFQEQEGDRERERERERERDGARRALLPLSKGGQNRQVLLINNPTE